MADGDLLDGRPWQVEIGGTLTGMGTDWQIAENTIGGLGVPPAKTHDTDLLHAAGSYLGKDYTGSRLLTVPYLVVADDCPLELREAAAGAKALTLMGLWAATEDDQEIHLLVPGFGHVWFLGRPRGLVVDFRRARRGIIEAFATWFCGDPTMTSVAAVEPGAPTIGTATAGVRAVTVTWTPPALTGGSPLTGFWASVFRNSDDVQVGPNVYFAGGATTSGTINAASGYAPAGGVAVYVKVRAENAVGLGGFSGESNVVTPTGLPGAPTIGVASAGSGSATANWSAPADNGGSAITGYVVDTYDLGNVLLHHDVVGNVTTFLRTGLTPGADVFFVVYAVNSVGQGVQSGFSNVVTPTAVAPGAPTIGAASGGPGTGEATANWTAPAYNGGSAITGYVVSSYLSPGGTLLDVNAVGLVLTYTDAGLTPAANVYFRVQATNAIGSGAQSAASNVVAVP